MWESFLRDFDAQTVNSRGDFELASHQYLHDIPTLAHLLQYLPSGLLVRVFLPRNSCDIQIDAVVPPKNSVIFLENQHRAVDTGPDALRCTRTADTTAIFARDVLKNNAVRFYYTTPRTDAIAREGQVHLMPVDFIRITDLIEGKDRKLHACLKLTPAQHAMMLGASNAA